MLMQCVALAISKISSLHIGVTGIILKSEIIFLACVVIDVPSYIHDDPVKLYRSLVTS